MAKGKPRKRKLKPREGVRRLRPRQFRSAEFVVLTPMGRWETQMARLQEWRARMEATPSMHGPQWRAGVLRHIDALIATHAANKPPSA